MQGKLRVVTDWESRAQNAHYSVAELAEHTGVTERTLRRFLRSKYGICPREWLRKLRMQQAVRLLRNGDRVNEVAHTLSYADSCQFTRAFKAYHDCPPSHYLKRLRQTRP